MVWLWMIVGLVALVIGAELLVRGAAVLATAARISPLVVGLTVVAFGTSAPEMAVSAVSSMRGEPDIALGNVVGSNIFNVLFVLGASALLVPLVVSRQLIRFDVPLMIAISLATYGLSLDGRVSRIEGTVMFAGLLVYTAWLIRMSRGTMASSLDTSPDALPRVSLSKVLVSVVWIVFGLGLLVIGANQLVDGATTIARAWGVSDLVIGVTIVAVGTSLPEVATSLTAAFKGERDLAVGNVVGSNLFNLMGVLGLSAFLSPTGVAVAPEAMRVDLPVMIAVAVVCWPIVFTRHTVERWEGALMVFGYVVYTGYLILVAEESEYLDTYTRITLIALAPMALVLFVALTYRDQIRNRET